MGNPKRIIKKEVLNIKDLSIGAIHSALKNGISEKGERECAYFAGHIEAMSISYAAYLDELEKVPLSDKVLEENIHPLVINQLSPGQKKAIVREAKNHLRGINMFNRKVMSVLNQLLKTYDIISDDAKDFIFEEMDKRQQA